MVSAIDFFAGLKLPVFDRMIPKYEKPLANSNYFVVVALWKKSCFSFINIHF